MKKAIYFIIILLSVISCENHPEPFEFTIKATITGQDSCQLFYMNKLHANDVIEIPVINNTFEYTGSSLNLYTSLLLLDPNFQKGEFQIVIEPGEIVVELNTDSLTQKSKVISGPYSLLLQEARKELSLLKTKNETIEWIKNNNENYWSIYFLSQMELFEDFMPTDELGEFLKSIHDKKLKKSREYIRLYSIWLSKKDSINNIGKEATNFELPNIDNEVISFNSVSNNKLTFVERSGSWCKNSTRTSRELKPLYEKYKENGFEIITVVPETNLDRWEEWIAKEKFPWINLIELEDDINTRGKSYSSMLFKGLANPNYLVDKNGEIIATNLSTDALSEILMKLFEPEEHQKYIEDMWNLPEETYILDKEEVVNSFDELVQEFSGKPFLIDCWATWCSPCLEEFKYNEQLHTFLKSKDMELVYINFDDSIDDAKWTSTIKKHDLKGYHFRINSSFEKDFTNIGFSGRLPTYMIIDSNGVVAERNAFRPSQKEKLFNQIISVIEKNVP